MTAKLPAISVVYQPLPANTEAEEQVLACILSNPRLIVKASDRLKPEHFATPDLANMYDSMLSLLSDKKEPTVFNVASELARRQLRTDDIKQIRHDVSQLKESFALGSHVDEYITALTDASKFRRGIAAAQQVYAACIHQDKDAIEKAIEAFSAISLNGDTESFSTFAESLDSFMDDYKQRREELRAGRVAGLSTGFKSIDRFFRFFPEDLNILAARTSIGKTSWALIVALHTAKLALSGGDEVAFFSLEMSKPQLVQRLLSIDAQINQSLLRDGNLDEDEHQHLLKKADSLRPIGLHISDSVRGIDEIKSNARLLCSRRNIGLIIVDYIQLIRPNDSRMPRHEAVAEISRDLKALAQQLQVPILALAQLNRAGAGQEPDLVNLGESDAIARDADSVSIIHVPSEEMEKRSKGENYNVIFKVKKNRHGALGEVLLGFRPRLTKFEDITEEYSE